MKKIVLLMSFVVFLLSGCAPKEPKVDNVILMIGDGMGLTIISAVSMDQYREPLNIESAQYVGIQKTYSADSRVTESAASGTALACGEKTNNGTVGLDPDGNVLESSLVVAQKARKATGLVVTSPITDATPSAFYAHVEKRSMQDQIAEQLVDSNIDVIAGTGLQFFDGTSSERNLIEELTAKGYTFAPDKEAFFQAESTPVALIVDERKMPMRVKDVDGTRGYYLPDATAKAIELLEDKGGKRGFFLMVEGSMIDWAAHANDYESAVGELRDFDNAVRIAFDYADAHPGTLVVVTGDHETGGLVIEKGNGPNGMKMTWVTNSHSGTFLPVFAYGTGAEHFTGVMENTEISHKIKRLISKK